MRTLKFNIWRGGPDEGHFESFDVPFEEGMVVLDAVHHVQAHDAHDLAARWNCKAGKCGSCGAEVNGKPKLMCMTRIDTLPLDEPITIQPMQTFPKVKDLVSDVTWNFKVNTTIPPLKPRPRLEDGTHRMMQKDIDRIQEFNKCIECFLCQDTCHILRDHQKFDFIGPRFLVREAGLVMHPLDTLDRLPQLKDVFNIEYCNITRCCTEVCPEEIHITDNAIIPLKERIAGRYYDPLTRLWRRLTGRI